MTTKPIAFSAPMVLAIQDGIKTETRRPLRFPMRSASYGGRVRIYTAYDVSDLNEALALPRDSAVHPHKRIPSLPRAGEYRWVQEAHRLAESTWTPSKRLVFCEYVADGLGRFLDLTDREWGLLTARKGWPPRSDSPSAITPPRFMYRSLSRLNLRVKAVRVERLHAITEAGAIAEGLRMHATGWTDGTFGYDTVSARDAYRELWESIYGAGSWALNPFVSVTSFEVVR